jgi:hypothetical protein
MQKLPKYMHKPRKFLKNQCVQGKPTEINPEVVFEMTNEKGEKLIIDAGKMGEKTALSDEMNQRLQDFVFGSGETPQKSIEMKSDFSWKGACKNSRR